MALSCDFLVDRWRYSIIVTNIPAAGGIGGVPGSHHAQFTDVLHRQHAVAVRWHILNGYEWSVKDFWARAKGDEPGEGWHGNFGAAAEAQAAAEGELQRKNLPLNWMPVLPDTERGQCWQHLTCP